MIRPDMHEAMTQLPRYIARLQDGETILLCRDNKPVAEIRAVPRARTKPRPFGLARGQFTVPDSFFEPLPDDVIESFEGGAVLPEE